MALFLQAEAVPTEPATAAAAAVLLDFQHLAMLLMVVALLLGGIRGRWKTREDRLGVPSSAYHFADLMVIVAILGMYYIVIVLTTLGQMNPKPPVDPVPEKVPLSEAAATGQFLFSLILHGLYVGLIYAMIRFGQIPPNTRSATDLFGLRRLRAVPLILWILGGALVATPMVLSLMEPVKAWLTPLFGELGEQGAVAAFRETAGWNLPTVFLVITAVVIAPIAEEVIFRGYLYGILKRFTDTMSACLVASLFFAVAHANLPALLPLMFFAIFLTLLYEATRSLWVTIGVHALFNATNVVLLFVMKDAEG